MILRNLWEKGWFSRIVIIICCLAILAVYLNIRWALGTYLHDHVIYAKAETFPQKFWQGGWGLFHKQDVLLADKAMVQKLFQFEMSLLWPFFIFSTLILWSAYGLWLLLYFLGYGIYCLLWLMFAGGLAKVLEVG